MHLAKIHTLVNNNLVYLGEQTPTQINKILRPKASTSPHYSQLERLKALNTWISIQISQSKYAQGVDCSFRLASPKSDQGVPVEGDKPDIDLYGSFKTDFGRGELNFEVQTSLGEYLGVARCKHAKDKRQPSVPKTTLEAVAAIAAWREISSDTLLGFYLGDQLRQDLAKLIAAAESDDRLRLRLLHAGIFLDDTSELYKQLEVPPALPPRF